jgi:hypothetical protein
MFCIWALTSSILTPQDKTCCWLVDWKYDSWHDPIWDEIRCRYINNKNPQKYTGNFISDHPMYMYDIKLVHQ